MVACSLTMYPYGKQAFTVDLFESNGKNERIDRILTESNGVSVFSDLSYEFSLTSENITDVQNVAVYINDVYEESVYRNGRILFPNRNASDRRIFLDCYGFVEIVLVISDSAGSEHWYETPYIPVLVRRGTLNDAVKAMVNYVYSNQEVLLLNGEPKAKNLGNLKGNGLQTLSAQLLLAEEIAALYESSYGYFKANSRFKIDKIAKVDRLERLQTITPSTLQFIATHPEQLRQINSNAGIRIGMRVYQPEKTLSMQNAHSYNTYENRVVLGFIGKMIDSIKELQQHCFSLLEQIPDNEEFNTEYIYSSYFMFTETRQMLERGMHQLTNLSAKFAQLWTMYSSILNITPEIMLDEPHPSPIFMSVPQYNRIFVQIHKWFHFGIYNFAKEHFMLSFIKISALYESYLLAKMVKYFQERGYTLESTQKCAYPINYKWKYKNTICNNTFIFKNEKHRLKLFYQPVVYDTDKSNVNGIGLLRNNSISGSTGENDDRQAGGHYYSPDYIIKVEEGSSARYLILDAKFSDLVRVRRYYVRDLAFKYLFSISPIQPTDSVEGLCLIYGKCAEAEQLQSAYDNCLPGQRIAPIAELLPMIEGVANENHYKSLDSMMRIAFPNC